MKQSGPTRDGPLFWVVPVALCIGLAALIAVSDLNIPVFLWIQRAASRAQPEMLWESVTLFGNGLVAVVLSAFWLRSRPEAVWAGLLGAIPAAVISRLFKIAIDVPRPVAILLDQAHVLGPAYKHSSFPSGHAITAFLIAAIACSIYRNISARTLIIAGAGLVAVSRVVIGVHWPIDVLCGAAAGWVSAHAGLIGAQRWPVAQRPWPHFALSLLVLAASLGLFYARLDLPLADPVRFAVATVGCVLSTLALLDALRTWRVRRV